MHFTDYHTRLAAYGLIIDEADRILLTLGTTETSGTTDFARWIPLAEARVLRPCADIVAVASRQPAAA